ncbi:hypothetical protein [Micromonospora sp. B9E7]
MATTIREHEWQLAPPGWDAPLSAELGPLLVSGDTWQVDEQHT